MKIGNRGFYGIGAAGFSYAAERTRTNTTGSSFARQAAEAAQRAGKAAAALHGADEGTGDTTIGSWADVVSGSSMSVYRTQEYDPENPVYKVKIWDPSGKVTERMVDVSEVDPQNCDTAEMYAYTSHLKESGKGSFEETVLKAAVAKAAKGAEQKGDGTFSFSEKVDWLKLADDMMQSAYRLGDLKGYMDWKGFLGILEEKHRACIAGASNAGHHERAFKSVGPNAPEEVKTAWMEAAKEAGINGLGMKENGMLGHISQMLVQQVINTYNGKPNPQDILGSTVQSALAAAQKALYALENPLRPSGSRSPEVQQLVQKEKAFYKAFISKLQMTDDREEL